VRFEGPAGHFTPLTDDSHSARKEMNYMQEEKLALEAQNMSLQLLVSELLLTNHQLRMEVAQLKQKSVVTAPAIHPPQRQDR